MPIRAAKLPDSLTPKSLRWRCDPKTLSFSSTFDLEPINAVVGQDRAMEALELGVSIKKPGYNVFIAGLSGVGKTTAVKRILDRMIDERAELKDYAYVHNFRDPRRPRLLVFPAGDGAKFQKEFARVVEYLAEKAPGLFDDEKFRETRRKLVERFREREAKLLSDFEETLSTNGFTLGHVETENGARQPDVLPIVNGEPVPAQHLGKLVEEEKLDEREADKIVETYRRYKDDLRGVYNKGVRLNAELREGEAKLRRHALGTLIDAAFDSLEPFRDDGAVSRHLDEAREDMLDNAYAFYPAGEDERQEALNEATLRLYDVNLAQDNAGIESPPVVVEISPTYKNLFGVIEKTGDGRGGWYSDFTHIKSGSLLRANGGYLVLRAERLFEEPGAWRTLKSALAYRRYEIQDPAESLLVSPATIQPEAIEIDAKVILIGSARTYAALAAYEDDFKKIFKIKAEFDYEVDRDDDALLAYARVLKKTVEEEGLLDFSREATATLLELAARYAGKKTKLTTRFSAIVDLAREAEHYARADAAERVAPEHVDRAYEQSRRRHGLWETKISEMIREGDTLLETEGERVGQINGLAVFGSEFHAYGKPTRISASVSMGAGSIVNVEREAGYSGKSYDKAMLIITGYFRETFGSRAPLSFNASVVFEQSYGPIDGDSASAAEICALVSALSEVPIKQGVAITGSVNQKGEIQPIGGVNEKIEGFFEVCKERGLTGEQGVVVPAQNVKDLMLKDEVVQAAKKKKFHVWGVERIDEAIEIMTGKVAATRCKDGSFGKTSVYGAVETKLKTLFTRAKQAGKAALSANKPKRRTTKK
jgi:lon-related putative ATP-dependent protease